MEKQIAFRGRSTTVEVVGEGPPLVVLHHDIGACGGPAFAAALASRHTVWTPTLPGWGIEGPLEWARDARDVAITTRQLLTELGLSGVPVVGLGFGGWLAAEIATMCDAMFSRLVLVAPVGLKPPSGELRDQFMMSSVEYVREGFSEPSRFDATFSAEPGIERLEEWEFNREMATRIAWSPYMYSQTLPHLLAGVTAPTLLVWGEQDRIVPFSCVEEYARLIPGARVATLPGAGHYVEIEQPEALAGLVEEFLGIGAAV